MSRKVTFTHKMSLKFYIAQDEESQIRVAKFDLDTILFSIDLLLIKITCQLALLSRTLEEEVHPDHFLCMKVKRILLQLYGSR
jgi:hypothetical protein